MREGRLDPESTKSNGRPLLGSKQPSSRKDPFEEQSDARNVRSGRRDTRRTSWRNIFISLVIGLIAGGLISSYLWYETGHLFGPELSAQRLVPQPKPPIKKPAPSPELAAPDLWSQDQINQLDPKDDEIEWTTKPEPSLAEQEPKPELKQEPQQSKPKEEPPQPAGEQARAGVVPPAQDRLKVIPHPPGKEGDPGIMEGVPVTGNSPSPVLPSTSVVTMDAINELRKRDLLLPVQGLKREDLRDSFNEKRGTRVHQAIDILAPRNTPVLAVDEGTIAKLWLSAPGGITIYQFDKNKNYEYYYAHLESYADGLKEGAYIKKGQVIGYVGTSGNAPKNTPHLHFVVYKLNDKKHWSEGTPLNPYYIYR